MSDCIFCKIANGEIPSAAIYEDEEFRVILDMGPASKGHALVLPKKHFADISEMPEDLLGKAFSVAKRAGIRLKEGLGADGLNVVQNNGEAAGQTVFHFHIHLIPRYAGAAPIVSWQPGTLTEEEKAEILAKCAVG